MHSDQLQQNAFHNSQQHGAGFGPGWLGPGAYGQGGYGLGGFGQFNPTYGWGGMTGQRQLTPFDVSAILQQIAPILPQIIAQAQQQQYMPQAAFGGGFGGHQRSLSPQDVNEVVRQILPVIPQLLQSTQTPAWQGGFGQFGLGQTGQGGYGQSNWGWGQAAYGLTPQLNSFQQSQSRQLTPQDVAEISRQLAEAIPQMAGVQPVAQQRV